MSHKKIEGKILIKVRSILAICSFYAFLKLACLVILLVTISSDYCVAQDTSCGIVWYPPIQLSDSTRDAYLPRIALSGEDTVHVTWETFSYEFGFKLPYARSVSGGSTFEPNRELLTDTISYPYETNTPFVVAASQNVYMFFTSPTPPATVSNSPVRMLRSTDGGTTFGGVITISSDTAGLLTWATISGDTLALLYPPKHSERRILFSTDRGVTWIQLSEQYKSTARIAVSSDAFHLVQQPRVNGPFEITYRQSTDLGNSWSGDTVISSIDGWSSDLPTIAAGTTKCGTELLVAWRDTKYGWVGFAGASIISRAGVANGQAWLPENLLTIQPNGYNPSTAIHNNVRGVSWDAEVSPYDTIHPIVRSTNSSLTDYGPIKDLTPTIFRGGNQSITVSSHALHVVWEQKVGSTFRIFYRRGEFIPNNASFSLSTGLVEFDTTEINATFVDTIVVANTGSDPLVIGTAVSDHPENFSVMPVNDTIPPSVSHLFFARYTPKNYGAHAGKIIFYHNGQSSPDCFAVTGVSQWNSEVISYQAHAWNLVSVPLDPDSTVRLPSLFGYDGHYLAEDSMAFGYGYWAKPDTSEMRFEGIKKYNDSVSVKPGWNIIGSVSEPVPVTDIDTVPDSIIVSEIYGYDGVNYLVAGTLLPGRAYWVKVSQSGKIILAASGSPAPGTRKRIAQTNELPPPPPEPGTSDLKPQTPNQFALEQNYPNPYNPLTIIRYQIPDFGAGQVLHVQLRVYNVLGQVVAAPVDETEGPGYKSIQWDASKVPSGVYYYRLDAGSFHDSKKMILVK